jgi:sugar diacid utilization regulator
MVVAWEPLALPVAQLQAIVAASLDAARAVSGAELCAFAWHEPDGDRRLVVSGSGGSAPVLAAVERFERAGVPGDGDGGADAATRVAEVHGADGGRLGLLVAAFADAAPDEHADMLALLAGHLGVLLDSYVRRAPTGGAYEALYEIGTQIQAEESSLEGVLDLIVAKARDLIGTDVAWLALVDETGRRVRMAVTKGINAPAFERIQVAVGEGLGGTALRHGEAIVVPDYRAHRHATPEFVRQTLLEEGIVSVICVPMLREQRMVGALYVANRRGTDFAGGDTALLSALAAQASVAIENARLYRILEDQNHMLEQSFVLHRKLTDAGLRGVGLAGVGSTLAALIERTIVVEQSIALPFRARYEPPDATGPTDEEDAVVVPINAGAIELGRLAVTGKQELSELQLKALEQGATVLALELVKLRAARDVEWRLRGELLEELLEASGTLSEGLTLRSARLGVDIEHPHRVLVVQPDDDGPAEYGRLLLTVRSVVAREAVGRGGGETLAVKRGTRVVLALPDRMDDRHRAAIAAIQEAARAAGAPVSVGVSSLQRDFGTAFDEAVACLRLARGAGAAEAVLAYEDLGPLRFLLDAPDVDYAVALVRDKLGVFLEHDRTRRAPLLPTLRAYLDADGHHATVAERCFIHVSTLKYRLGRINELLEAPLSDPDTRFDLRLAFRILDLLEALGIDVDDGRSSSRRDE